MNPINEQRDRSVSMRQLFALLRRYVMLVLAAGLICGATTWCVCSFWVEPVYEAGANMIVNSRQEQTGNVTNDQMNSARRLVDTCAVIIRSQPVLQPVIEGLNLQMDVERLARMVTVTSVNETQIMRIAVRSTDPELAVGIVEQIVAICPPIILNAVEAGSVKTVEPACLKRDPVAPATNLFTLVAALMGMAAVVLVVLMRHLLDNTYESEMELQIDLGLPVLGVIPDYECCLNRRKAGTAPGQEHTPLLLGSPPFAYAEAYKALRTNLCFAANGKRCRTIMITSAVPNEGKSTAAINLAVTLARSGAKVLLMDCDLRSGAIRRLLRIRPDCRKGLSGLLSGKASLEECLFTHSRLNCDVLLAGAATDMAAELLGSGQMKALLERLDGQYDYIICDTPPVSIVTDAAALSGFCDGVILLVRHKVSTRDQVFQARRNLDAVQANILGTILTGYDRTNDTWAGNSGYMEIPEPVMDGFG